MAYVKNGKVVIYAFHTGDMEPMFRKLKVWEDFTMGRMKCVVCGKELNHDNLGALVTSKGKIRGACERIICITRAQTLIEAEVDFQGGKVKT